MRSAKEISKEEKGTLEKSKKEEEKEKEEEEAEAESLKKNYKVSFEASSCKFLKVVLHTIQYLYICAPYSQILGWRASTPSKEGKKE